MSDIEIETSTDTVEEVREALGATVEIEESEPAPEEKKPVKSSKEEKADPEESEEEESDEEEAETEKPKKQTPHMVSRARLNKEIARRESLERQLAERQERPVAAVKAEPATSTEPQTYSGKPEPKIEDYVTSGKHEDPYAAFTKEHGAWVRAETLAEVAAGRAQEAANEHRSRVLGAFQKNVETAIKERIPDYKEVVPQSDVQISGLMEERIYKSDFGPDMLHALAENPDRAAEIMALDYADQVIAMADLEREIKKAWTKKSKAASDGDDEEEEAPPVKKLIPGKKVSNAPLPATRIKGGGPVPKTLEELAGPTDRTGIDIEFNPAYEKAVKAQRKI